MRFYDREQEIAFLRKERVAAETVARFTVVTGRRRIGKTEHTRTAPSYISSWQERQRQTSVRFTLRKSARSWVFLLWAAAVISVTSSAT